MSAILEGAMAPYVLLILFGRSWPSEVWRIAGVLVGRSIPADSPLLEWVRLVAMALARR